MGAFGGMIITNRGRALQAKAQTGVELKYTKIKIGDGNLGGQSIPSLNNLISPKMTLGIGKLTTRPGGQAVVGTMLSNAELTTGFYFRELGVFALDPDEGEILYCYANSGASAEYIPPGGGPDIIEKYINIITLVQNAPNVTAAIDQSLIWATQSDVDAVKQYTDQKLGDMDSVPTTDKSVAGAITELFTSVSDGKTKVADAITDKGVPTSATDTFQQMADNIGAISTGEDTSDATATAGDIIAGKTAYAKGEKLTGTIPDQGAGGTVTPGTTDQTKPAGCYTSPITIKGEPGLKTENIKAGVTLFGVSGKSSVVETGDATAVAGDILTGKTAYVNGAKRTGSMANRGNVSQTLTTQGGSFTIPAGYHAGGGKVTAQFANLVAQNILKGVNIGGVVGTLELGKRWASGLIPSSAQINGTIIDISGLSFTPTMAFAFATSVSSLSNVAMISIAYKNGGIAYRSNSSTSYRQGMWAHVKSNSYDYQIRGYEPEWKIDGLTMNIALYSGDGSAFTQIRWVAFE